MVALVEVIFVLVVSFMDVFVMAVFVFSKCADNSTDNKFLEYILWLEVLLPNHFKIKHLHSFPFKKHQPPYKKGFLVFIF